MKGIAAEKRPALCKESGYEIAFAENDKPLFKEFFKNYEAIPPENFRDRYKLIDNGAH